MTSNTDYVTRARRVTPGGVNSPVRAFGSVGGEPRVIVRASGATVTDADGRSYIDVVSSWGPALLGHAHPAVVDAVTNAARRGLSFGASSPDETRLAELIVDRVAPIEMVRLVSTGTEATMTAIRLARGVTGRDLLVKFSGHYHGHSDGLLAQAGSGVTTLAIPGSAGVPAAVAAQTLVIPYNAPDELEAVFARYGDRIAAVITEAAPANMGVVPPDPGFNALLADTAHRFGALLISDEVLTGFRVAADGFWGIENRPEEQYRPDIITFGKVIGGGLPVAAVAGSRAIMEHLAPLGAVYQAGTLSGNPVAVAAGLATLQHATPDVYDRIDRAAQIVANEAEAALRAAGVPHVVQRAGNLFSVFFGELVVGGVRSYEDAVRQETHRYAAFFRSMLDSGVWLPPSAFESWFVSAAYDARTIERVVAALPAAARAATAATP